ncbi:MAG: DUF47 domain-containing protein [Sphingomonas sp.]|nr:DUF47 domain-containing protein [Sphingomonas sp.]
MFAWFQRLLPRKGDFFALFEAHGETLVAAADALNRLATDEATTRDVLKLVRDQEHKADEIIREVLLEVRRTFLTPFDRGAITALIVAMDDTIDEMLSAARAIDLYGFGQFGDQMKQVVNMIAESAHLTAEALPLLRNVTTNGRKLHELTQRVVRLEGDADEFHAAGLKIAFQSAREDPLRFAVTREVFKTLEKVMDRFEDVANEIDGIVIDNS